MPIKDYSTTIDAARTAGEITAALARRGVSRISTLFDDDGQAAGLAFTMRTEFGPRDFELPVRVDGVHAALLRDKVAAKYQTPEHARKVAWRIAKDWLDAQVALIDAQLASLDEVLMPYMVTGYEKDGRAVTVFQQYRSTQKAIEA